MGLTLKPLLLILAIAAPAADTATDPAKDFEEMYGEELKRVVATRDARDDVDLAVQLLEAAKAPNAPPAMIVLLCEKAGELAMAAARNYEVAVQSLECLAELIPARKEECLTRIIALRQRQYDTTRGDARNAAAELLADALDKSAQFKADAGDFDGAMAVCRHALAVTPTADGKNAVKDKIALLAFRQKTARQLADLKAAVDANPADKPARGEMLRLYLINLDNPVEAAKWLTDAEDETMRKCLPEAVTPLAEAPGPACLELGDWYLGLSGIAPGFSKAAMLSRSAAYYSRFLDLYTADDELRTRAVAELKKVEAALFADWRNLLLFVRIPSNKETWERQGNAFVIRGSHLPNDNLAFSMTVEGGYKLRIEAIHNSTRLWVRFPVGAAQGEWSLGGKNDACTLAVGGKNRVKDESLVVEKGRRYVAEISVGTCGDQMRVTLAVEGGTPILWQAPLADLDPINNLQSDTPRFLVGGENPDMEIRSMRVLPAPRSKMVPLAKPSAPPKQPMKKN